MDITQSVVKIVMNGENLPFIAVQTSTWHRGPAYDLIISTKQRVHALYQFMWSQASITLAVSFLQGSDLRKLVRVTGIQERVRGEYLHHFSWE